MFFNKMCWDFGMGDTIPSGIMFFFKENLLN